ncbi:MAG: M56 family metallopeptidase [Ruminococcaceae bacterium]|nr:M56 family metallopeptidase [Oscillospiraceae bacterium]
MSQIFLQLLNMSITAGIIVLVVLILRLLLRRSPKWIRCILWGIVALRLMIPYSIESVFSLVPETEPIAEEIVYAEPVGAYTGIFALNTTLDVTDTTVNVTAPTPMPEETEVSYSAVDIASAVWLCGIGVMLVYAVVSSVRISRSVAEGVEEEKGIFLCDRISSPFIFGIIRPKIYLPSSIDECDKHYVIAHERAHIRRKDHWWKPIGFILLSVYWFNPLIWLGYILLCRDIELACDEKVISEMGEEAKKSYSTALINCSAKQRLVSACPVAFGETGVKGRIRSVLNYKKPAFWIIIVALIACIALAVFFLTDPLKKDVEELKVEYDTGIGYEDLELRATELTAESGAYSFVQTVEGAPVYLIGSDMCLYVEDEEGYIRYGIMSECEMTEEKFDSRFDNGYFEGIEEIKNNNEKMWELYSTSNGYTKALHILLLQKDGTIYIGCGYHGMGRNEPKNPDDSQIRWLYKVKSTVSTAPKAYRDVDYVYHDPNTNAILAAITEAYTCSESPEEILKPTISLSESDGRFQFTYSMFSSYLCSGKYEKTGNELILRTDDGENVYYFERKGEDYIFDAKRSSPMPRYKYSSNGNPEPPVADGAVFSPKPTLTPVIDYIESDIDNDGVKEAISITVGPTSGLYSFYLNVTDGDKDYRDMFITEAGAVSFVLNDEGVAVIKQDMPGEITRYLDIVLEGDHAYLYEEGVSIVHIFAQEVTEYSYTEDMADHEGMVEMINVDMHEKIPNISTAREAILEAHKRVKTNYDRVAVGYDESEDMWKINFYTEGVLGGDQIVYVSSDRSLIAVIYGD